MDSKHPAPHLQLQSKHFIDGDLHDKHLSFGYVLFALLSEGLVLSLQLGSFWKCYFLLKWVFPIFSLHKKWGWNQWVFIHRRACDGQSLKRKNIFIDILGWWLLHWLYWKTLPPCIFLQLFSAFSGRSSHQTILPLRWVDIPI